MIKNKLIRVFYPLLLLILPLVGMIFSDEIKWDIYDFIIMGALLLTLGITINYILTKNFRLKIIYIITAIFMFIMVWFELAVGIFSLGISGS